MEIYKIKQEPNREKKGSIVAGSGNLQKFLSFFLFILRAFKFGRAAEKNRKSSSHIFKGLKKQTKQTYVWRAVKKKKNSVVDTSGHKHRECILWTKSIITIRAKTILKSSRPTSENCNSKLFHRAKFSGLLQMRLNQDQILFKFPHKKKEEAFFKPLRLLKLIYKCKKKKKNLWWKGFI